MNQTIKKCIEELKKETFSKEYVLGMLETFLEMSGNQLYTTTISGDIKPILNNVKPIQETNEEDDILAKYTGGPIGKITEY